MVENDDTVQSNDESITKNKLFYPAQYNTADDSSPAGRWLIATLLLFVLLLHE